MEITQDSKVWHATVDTSGRILLPAGLRQTIQAPPGTDLVLTMSDGGLRLQNVDELIASIQDYFVNLSPSDEVWSEELISERRDEAGRE